MKALKNEKIFLEMLEEFKSVEQTAKELCDSQQ